MGESVIWSRRALLRVTAAGAVAASISGCTDGATSSPAHRTSAAAIVQPNGQLPAAASLVIAGGDVALVTSAIDDEVALGALYDRIARGHRPLAAKLRPLIRAQRAHRSVLASGLSEPAPGTFTTDKPGPRNQAAAVRAVLREAGATSARRTDDSLAAESGPLARVLASIAAAHAVTAATWGVQ